MTTNTETIAALDRATRALDQIRDDAESDAMRIDGKPTHRMAEDLGNLYASVRAIAIITALLAGEVKRRVMLDDLMENLPRPAEEAGSTS